MIDVFNYENYTEKELVYTEFIPKNTINHILSAEVDLFTSLYEHMSYGLLIQKKEIFTNLLKQIGGERYFNDPKIMTSLSYQSVVRQEIYKLAGKPILKFYTPDIIIEDLNLKASQKVYILDLENPIKAHGQKGL